MKLRIFILADPLPWWPLLVSIVILVVPDDVRAGGVVSETSESALRAAVAGGGVVTFSRDGTWLLSSPLTPTNDLTIDGGGHTVILSGGNTTSMLRLTNAVRATLANLTIQHCQGIWGGAIYNSNGVVNLLSVRFVSNAATNNVLSPPNALAEGGNGGAVYNSGTINATNCLFLSNTAQQRQTPDRIEAAIPDSFYVATPCNGGAIYNSGQLSCDDCVFQGNSAWAAPGRELTRNGTPLMVTSGREAAGGAVMSPGYILLNRCTFCDNVAIAGWSPSAAFSPTDTPYPGVTGSGAAGGALSAERASISTCSFISNSVFGGGGGSGGSAYYSTGGRGGPGGAAFGGAIKIYNGSIANSAFAWNSAAGGGGGGGGAGVILVHSGTGGGPGAIGGSGQGGGVYAGGGGVAVVNSTIVSNYTYGGQGGYGGSGALSAPSGPGGSGGNGNAQCFGPSDALTNCTFGFNFTLGGPGGVGSTSGSSGAASGGFLARSIIMNCILAINTPANWFDWVADLGCNISTDTGGFTNASSRTSTDPRLSVVAMNGGPTLTMALLPDSLAIDAAAPTQSPSVDERGYPRPAGPAPDIGAFEYGSVLPFLSVSKSISSGLLISAQGNTNQPCRLVFSTNLVSWTTMASNRFGADGLAQFTELNVSASALKWYRVTTP